MTKILIITLVALGLLAYPVQAQEDSVSAEDAGRFSYNIGTQIGKSMATLPFDVDVEKLVQGLKDKLAGGDLAMSEEELDDVQMAMQELMMQEQLKTMSPEQRAQVEPRMKQQMEMMRKGRTNKVEGAAYREENGKKEGVVTLDSGLQYEVITKGTGAKPDKTDSVMMHYTGTLLDGTKFDSSVDKNTPFKCSLAGGVIQGWLEALALMQVGDKWKLTIPSDLAYGERGSGAVIGPNATLIFDVEMLEIVAKTSDNSVFLPGQ
jgi:FKBP-type peptidyl-prolyl cis-trans isomerase